MEQKRQLPAPATETAPVQPMVLDLPPNLSAIIQADYTALIEAQRKLQTEYEQRTRLLLQGFLAANPDADQRTFDLSEDKTMLIEKA